MQRTNKADVMMAAIQHWQIPQFASAELWLVNSPDLNLVGYHVCGRTTLHHDSYDLKQWLSEKWDYYQGSTAVWMCKLQNAISSNTSCERFPDMTQLFSEPPKVIIFRAMQFVREREHNISGVKTQITRVRNYVCI